MDSRMRRMSNAASRRDSTVSLPQIQEECSEELLSTRSFRADSTEARASEDGNSRMTKKTASRKESSTSNEQSDPSSSAASSRKQPPQPSLTASVGTDSVSSSNFSHRSSGSSSSGKFQKARSLFNIDPDEDEPDSRDRNLQEDSEARRVQQQAARVSFESTASSNSRSRGGFGSGVFSRSGSLRGSSGERGDSSGGFTSNLTRKSQNFRNSIARHTNSLARFTSRTSSMDSDAMDAAAATRTTVYRYSIGDSVLISNHDTRWSNCVNRFGYPKGLGNTIEEQRGPYIYVLGKVKTVHYEENAVFYTVTRADTGVHVRGDPDFMEHITDEAGERAATKAATDYALGSSLEEHQEEDDQSTNLQANDGVFTVVRSILEVLALPFFLIYDLFVFAIGARLFRWGESIFGFLRRQAHSFLKGSKPYECSTTITTVNIFVLCNIWYMFIDQARLAFFPAESDGTLAIVNFVIWCILSSELMFEVFIRPDDYFSLIESDKAYTPNTVRFISGLHMAVEFASLAFFVPEFLCLFSSETSCDGKAKFSFLHATMLAIAGPTRVDAFLGRAFYACLRLRVFSLVRHWRNMWVNSKYMKRDRQRQLAHRVRHMGKGDRSFFYDGDGKSSIRTSTRNRLLQKQRDAALINASNIGSALMVTNSYRALTILCTIIGFFPMITLIFCEGVVNSVPARMIGQLQATNELVMLENATNCEFLVESVEAWASSWTSREHNLITVPRPSEFLVAMALKPARCVSLFEELEVNNLSFQPVSCDTLPNNYDLDVGSGDCILGILDGARGSDLHEIAHNMGLRVGNIQTELSESTLGAVEFEDGSVIGTEFQVAAHFNQTHAVESSALASFLLQFCLLITVLVGLIILRRDAEDLVLRPLRSMLKIVARYAKNPLAQTDTSSKDNQSVLTDSESEATSHGSDGESSEGDGFGTDETEQLITAVSKITDLLRKCWGVAGADIISTNLASHEGELAEVFNPTVPGKSVYALFAFAAINGFDHALKCLGGDVMILINDVAAVLHGEVYRWGFGDSGQCNKNLGAAFLMVFRIGLVKEVKQKLDEATRVIFKSSEAKNRRQGISDGKKMRILNARHAAPKKMSKAVNNESDTMADVMKLSLQSLPGIATFTDRAVIGMLKSFAGIHRDNKLRAWSRDFRLSAGVGAFEVNMIFGMDAGWAVEGAVGSEYKIDATYLSPHVNMASRMMSACKHYGVTILLSETVQELMSDAAKSKLRNVDRVTVKGSVRIQKIFTFDARHKGADFFLFSRSDDVADSDAEQYVPSIWSTDQDLQAMRHHVTDDFESEFNIGMKAYYSGDWKLAIEKLEHANEIMVDAAMEEGYLHDEMDDSPDRKELYRAETADGPCSYLVHYMTSKGGVAPDDWAGWHPLLSK